MDEKAAITRIDELESRIRELTQDNVNLKMKMANWEAFLNEIPKTIPGQDEEVLAYEWINWAKSELGG
jgi:hypothetical protein